MRAARKPFKQEGQWVNPRGTAGYLLGRKGIAEVAGDTADLHEFGVVGAFAAAGMAVASLSVWSGGSWAYYRRHHHAHVLVTLAGQAEGWFGGDWQTVRTGTAFISRAGVEHGFRVAARGRWEYALILYEPNDDDPVLSAMPEPLLREADPTGLHQAIENTHRESLGPADPSVLRALVALIDAEARRLIRAAPVPSKLHPLWVAVARDLARPWTTGDMAGVLEMSEMQLWRLCREDTGMSPKAYLTTLRMRRGAELLYTTDQTVEKIALMVGYEGQRSFNKAFRRQFGIAPGRHRARVRGQ